MRTGYELMCTYHTITQIIHHVSQPYFYYFLGYKPK